MFHVEPAARADPIRVRHVGFLATCHRDEANGYEPIRSRPGSIIRNLEHGAAIEDNGDPRSQRPARANPPDWPVNTPGRIRTCDRRFRKPLLYPPELRAQPTRCSSRRRPWHRSVRPQLDELRPAGFEPATCGLGNRRSILLSYEREVLVHLGFSGIAGFPVNFLADRSRRDRNGFVQSRSRD